MKLLLPVEGLGIHLELVIVGGLVGFPQEIEWGAMDPEPSISLAGKRWAVWGFFSPAQQHPRHRGTLHGLLNPFPMISQDRENIGETFPRGTFRLVPHAQ